MSVDDAQIQATKIRPRRWFQFSLRTLLLITALAAVWMSLVIYRVRLSPANVAGLRSAGKIDQEVWKFHWSPDRKRVAFVGWEKPVEIRRGSDFSVLETVPGKLIGFAFSSDPDVIAFCDNSKTAEIRNLRTGSVIKINAQNEQPDLAFSPDGKHLATGGYGNSVRLWNVADGQLVNTLNVGQATGALRPVFSPDGKLLAVGNRNSTTTVFDVATGTKVCTLSKQMSQELQFDPSGKRLAVAYVDGTVSLWDISGSGKLFAESRTGAQEMYTVDWSSDGTMLAAAGLDGDVVIFDGATLQTLTRIPWQECVSSVCFTPDGGRLLTAGGQRVFGGKQEVAIWRTAPDWFEITLNGLRWGLAAALLVFVVVAPIIRAMRRGRHGISHGPAAIVDQSNTSMPVSAGAGNTAPQ